VCANDERLDPTADFEPNSELFQQVKAEPQRRRFKEFFDPMEKIRPESIPHVNCEAHVEPYIFNVCLMQDNQGARWV
jgi:hypothetical protein